MADSKNAHMLRPSHVAVEREEAIFTFRDDELAKLIIDDPADQRMTRENRNRFANGAHTCSRTGWVVGVEVQDAFEILERMRHEDYLRHFFGLGRRAGVPLMRAVRYSNTSSDSK